MKMVQTLQIGDYVRVARPYGRNVYGKILHPRDAAWPARPDAPVNVMVGNRSLWFYLKHIEKIDLIDFAFEVLSQETL